MKLLNNISKEKYNDVQWVLKWLEENPEVGDETPDPIEYFHCFWKGPLSDLHLMSLDSLHKTNPNVKIILWTPEALEAQGTHSWAKIKKLLKDNIQVIQINKEHFNEANAEAIYAAYVLLIMENPDIKRYNYNIAYASDIIRFIVLYIYGGVWFDMDVLFLRDFNSIKLNRYVSQWGDGPVFEAGNDLCGNAAIMRLEKGHNLISKILKYKKPFYPTTSFQLKNDLDITILPSTFFDILWTPSDKLPPSLQFKTFDDFFKIDKWMMPEEIYAYHWHNRWKNPVPSFFPNI